MRTAKAILTGLVLVLGQGFAQNESEPAATESGDPGGGNPGSSSLVGVLETREGAKWEGVIAIGDNAITITPGGATPVATPLGEIVSLEVERRMNEGQEPPETLLSGALPAPWRNRDLGRTLVPGKARWLDGRFIVSASPRAADERFAAFHLVYAPVKGDCEIQARVVSLANEGEDSYAGIVICDGTTPEHRKAVLGVHPYGEKGVNFRRWGYQGGSSTGRELPTLKLPYWVKLVREGYDVTAYHSPDGRRWRMLKVSAGRMRDEKVYVGLAVQVEKFNRLSEVVIDRVSINGEDTEEAEPMLPHVVLRAGSRLATDVLKANRTAFHLGGRWEGRTVTAPQVARLEFFQPLPAEVAALVQGDRAGLLLRSGDFLEGAFDSLGDGRLRLGSVLLGVREHSILDEADCLVLRKVAPEPASYRVETQAGSILLAQRAILQGEKLVLQVAGLGEAQIGVEDLRSLGPLK